MDRVETTTGASPATLRNLGYLAGEDGQVLAEYALILVFVSLVALALTPLGPTLSGVFQAVSAALAAAL